MLKTVNEIHYLIYLDQMCGFSLESFSQLSWIHKLQNVPVRLDTDSDLC